MKKLVLLLAAFVLAITLAACNRDLSDLQICLDDPTAPECQTACPTGQELVGTECLDVCPTGEHREGTACVIDTLSCPSGQSEVDGACVLDDTRTPEEIAIDLLIANYDGDMTFLSTAMVNMHFENALTMTSEFNFEVTEDIDEVHYIEAIIIDSFVYDETSGDMIKRDIYLDVDDEQTLDFAVILHEVPTGVHVYIEAAPIITLMTEGNPMALNTLNWVGFDDQWAVFELDDSLQNVVELSVLKDMVVALFFSEMGETFFTDVQENQIEEMLGFDLSQYGVDLGLLVDTIIEENWDGVDGVEDQIDGIEFENIALHLDAVYVAPHLLELVENYETDLRAAAWPYDTLVAMLEVSTWNAVDEVWEATLPVDPLDGSKAFLEAMTEPQLEQFIDLVVKPSIEEAVYDQLINEYVPEMLDQRMHDLIQENEGFLATHWPESSPTFDSSAEMLSVDTLGAVAYWNSKTEEEQGVIWWSVDHMYNGWVVHELEEARNDRWDEYDYFFRRNQEEWDINYIQTEFVNFLNNNGAEFSTTYSIDVSMWVTDINNMGVHTFYRDLDMMDVDAIYAVGTNGSNDHFMHIIDMLGMVYDDYAYGYHFMLDEDTWSDDWVVSQLTMLINDHTGYLMDEYSIDANVLITEITNSGGIEWYLNMASSDVKNALRDIADFNGQHGRFEWFIELLDEMYEHQDRVHIWYGRAVERRRLQYFQEEVVSYIDNSEAWFTANTIYSSNDWLVEIENDGLQAWWEQLDSAEITAIKDSLDDTNTYPRWAIEELMDMDTNPDMYAFTYGTWDNCYNINMLDERLYNLVDYYVNYIDDNNPPSVSENMIQDIEDYGAIEFYLYMADEDELEILEELADMDTWQRETLKKIEDIIRFEEDLYNLIMVHETELEAGLFPATAALPLLDPSSGTYIGVQDYLSTVLMPEHIGLAFDIFVYPPVEGLHAAIEADEVPEFIMDEFFTDPHVLAAITELGVNEVFDHTIIATNMMAIDFDLLETELETFDFEALAMAIREGQTEYDTYVATLTTFPNIQEILEVFSPTVASINEYMVYVDDIEYAFESLTLFDQFIDLEYYLDDVVDVTPTRTEDAEMLMTFEIDGLGYATLFSDFTDQLGIYLDGFNTIEDYPYDDEWNCINPIDCTPPDFASIIGELTTLGDVMGHVKFDPADLTWVELGIDVTDLLDGLVADNYAEYLVDHPSYTPHPDDDMITGVNEFSFTVTLENSSTIALPAPTDTDNVNEIVEDIAKFGITMEAYDILRDYARYYESNPLMLVEDLYNSPVMLEDIDFMEFSAAFDLEMSYIEITVPMLPNPVPELPDIPDVANMDYEVVLYWIDGTLVHDDAVGIQDILPLYVDGDLVSEAGFNTLVGMVDETNWHMMKLFAYYLMEDMN